MSKLVLASLKNKHKLILLGVGVLIIFLITLSLVFFSGLQQVKGSPENETECRGGSTGEIFPKDKWYVCYYQGEIDSTNFLGSEKNITSEFLNLSWGTGEIYAGLSDNISASFRRIVDFDPGYYKFNIISDDAADLLVDRYDVYRTQEDLYQTSGYNSYISDPIYLEGKNYIRVLWHENTGSAQLRLIWQKVEVKEKTSIGIDLNTFGNTATSLGSIEGCISIDSNQTLNVDLFIKESSLLSSQGISLGYDPSLIEIINIDPNMFLAANTGSSTFNNSEIHNDRGYSFVGLADTNTALYQSVESGSGVLARIGVKAIRPGLALLTVTPKDINQDQVLDYGPELSNAGGYRIRDLNNDNIFDGPIINAVMAIDQACVDDFDNDGFSNEAELYMGTDPLDACPDNNSDDAWPPDINKDGSVNVLDLGLFRSVINSSLGDLNYSHRFDLNTDGAINVLDLIAYRPYINTSCTNP